MNTLTWLAGGSLVVVTALLVAQTIRHVRAGNRMDALYEEKRVRFEEQRARVRAHMEGLRAQLNGWE